MLLLAVTVRRMRPVLSAVAVVVWIAYRFSINSKSESFLRLLVGLLAQLENQLLAFVLDRQLWFLLPAIRFLWTVMEDALAVVLFLGACRLFYCLYHYSWLEWKDMVSSFLFEWASENVPVVAAELAKYSDKFRRDCDRILHKDPNRVKILELPQQGVNRNELYHELEVHAVREHRRWEEGKVTGTVYNDDKALFDLLSRVYSLYAVGNPLHAGYWPRLNQCEGEVIAMASNLLHGPPIGCITSGGTESIVLAIRAHVIHYGRCRGIHHPEIVCGTSAHASVQKAADMFGIRLLQVDCSQNIKYQLDPKQVRKCITSNTIMIYASAPSYPQGVIDPIQELSDIAQEYDIGLHVDACLGGFILPFCENVAVFDFRNAGVTSMSIDTHKYGYASKGSSVVVYKTAELRHGQYFSYPRWTGGIYMTPTIAGSRPGALSACAWAAMMSIGKEGYQQRAQRIVQAAREMASGIKKISGLYLLTQQPFMVVCFGSDELNIYRILDVMSELGWGLAALQSPASIHMCITLNVVPKVESFLADLDKAVARVRSEGKSANKKGMAGIYGMTGSLPEGPIQHVLNVFTDMTLSP